MTRVLSGDEISFRERLVCPCTQIAQVADRRRHDLQTAGPFDQRVLLADIRTPIYQVFACSTFFREGMLPL